jgi:hypothetical protein
MSKTSREKTKLRQHTCNLYMKDYKSVYHCWYCGETCVECLDFHHLRDKKKNIRKGSFYSLNSLQQEIDKCIVVCANCHRKINSNIYDSPSTAYHTIVYKFVVGENNKFYSPHANNHRLDYIVGKKTTPTMPHSKIFIYPTLKDVREKTNPNDIILECKALNVKYMTRISASESYDRAFWKLLKHHKKMEDWNFFKIAANKIFVCDELIPLKVIIR